MAPFLSLEWGKDGMEFMREIKDVFDPGHILNPGVILNDDPRVHVANLKHITPVTPPPAYRFALGRCSPLLMPENNMMSITGPSNHRCVH
jgi:D-lactate dehydrogenase